VTDLRDRFRGVIVGTAVGDALGRPVEGRRRPRLDYLDDMAERFSFFPYSDDTVLTVALAESLLACDGFDGADMARRFAEAWRAEPHRGYGRNVTAVFEAVLQGLPWEEAASRQFGGGGSYGNGGAMRVAPVALWAFPDLDETVRLATRTARVTHTHPVGVEGAILQAVAVHHALGDNFTAAALFDDLDRIAHTEEFRTRLKRLAVCVDRDDDECARLHLGHGVAAHTSVLTALFAFLVSADFEQTVLRAIGLGGDTDTIAAMAGAVAGARWGHRSIPAGWSKVENHDRLVALADRLWERTLPEGQAPP